MLNTAYAVDFASIDVGNVTGQNWQLQGVKLIFDNLNRNNAQFSLTAAKLVLPKPFNDLTFADIRCKQVTWNLNELHCPQGRASVQSAYWQSPETPFSIHITPRRSSLKLENVRIADSRFSLVVDAVVGKQWQGKLDAKHISNSLLEKLSLFVAPKMKFVRLTQDGLAVNATVTGYSTHVDAFNLTAEVNGLSDQTADGKVAAEKANLQLYLNGKAARSGWVWQTDAKITGGAFYVDPVYLEVASKPVEFNAQGWLDTKKMRGEIQSFVFDHPDVVRLTGNVTGSYREKVVIEKADISAQSDTLQPALATYIAPFFSESTFADVSVSGAVTAKINFVQQALNEVAINFRRLDVDDKTGRVGIKEGAGEINWSSDPLLERQSEFSWQVLALKGLPFETAKVKFTSRANAFKLADKVKLPFLNGWIAVDKFSWQGKQGDEPDVSFAGSLENLSLESLSKTLGWTPLSGNISGRIPGVDYHNKALSLGGELLIKVFDGTVKISQLKSSGLFSGFPRLESEIEFENLDLDQLTRKFEFGAITGRLSGYVKNLVLENWHPVSFYAWFGTPDNDDSSHRISQKAVKNIASIGGGGASDLLSRSFLSFFETFRYDKIGMGCYLNNGACQLMGLEVEAAGEGYYLIKGGFLPRIDIVGYNNHTDFEQLWQSVKTAIASKKNDIVVK